MHIEEPVNNELEYPQLLKGNNREVMSIEAQ
jgi:hypothetical protein